MSSRFESMNKTSQIVIKKIMALTMRLKRQEVSNEDLSSENDRLNQELQEQMENLQQLQNEYREFKKKDQENGVRRIRLHSSQGSDGDHQILELELDIGDSSETDSIGGMDLVLF